MTIVCGDERAPKVLVIYRELSIFPTYEHRYEIFG